MHLHLEIALNQLTVNDDELGAQGRWGEFSNRGGGGGVGGGGGGFLCVTSMYWGVPGFRVCCGGLMRHLSMFTVIVCSRSAHFTDQGSIRKLL